MLQATCCLYFCSQLAIRCKKIKYARFWRVFIEGGHPVNLLLRVVTWSLPLFVNSVNTPQISDDMFISILCCIKSDKMFLEQTSKYSGLQSGLEEELSDKMFSSNRLENILPENILFVNILPGNILLVNSLKTSRQWNRLSTMLAAIRGLNQPSGLRVQLRSCKVAKTRECWVAMNRPKMTNPSIQFVKIQFVELFSEGKHFFR